MKEEGGRESERYEREREREIAREREIERESVCVVERERGGGGGGGGERYTTLCTNFTLIDERDGLPGFF